jgi:hypothetical protein
MLGYFSSWEKLKLSNLMKNRKPSWKKVIGKARVTLFVSGVI